jgi:hypothetical protein
LETENVISKNINDDYYDDDDDDDGDDDDNNNLRNMKVCNFP